MDIQNILIVRYGEIALKGMNKPYFEKALLRRVRRACCSTSIKADTADGLIVVRGYAKEREEALIKDLLRIFGVATVSPAWELPSREQEDINTAAVAWVEQRLNQRDREAGDREAVSGGSSDAWVEKRLNQLDREDGNREDGDREAASGGSAAPGTNGIAPCAKPGKKPLTFKVFGKRSDKSWPLTSPEIAALTGEAVLEAFGGTRVKVDVHNPELRLHVHLRRRNVLIYEDMLKGFGGLPLGTNGKGIVLFSGGIDSPVAAWMMAKRGMLIEAVHFHSYPYTSKRAEEKVLDLVKILASYCGRIKVHVLNLLPVQEALAETCPEDEMTILVRRFMVRIAARVAAREACGFIITGENLGQVASQTAEGIAVTDAASCLPVLRPLIALDKVEIIEKAKEIGTFEVSILPYEDCCQVFVPKHPKTRPALVDIEASEKLLGAERIAALEEEVLGTEEIHLVNL